jgi:hypothetical protein
MDHRGTTPYQCFLFNCKCNTLRAFKDRYRLSVRPRTNLPLWVSLLAHAESWASSLMTGVLLLAYNVGKDLSNKPNDQAKPTLKKTGVDTHVPISLISINTICIHPSTINTDILMESVDLEIHKVITATSVSKGTSCTPEKIISYK